MPIMSDEIRASIREFLRPRLPADDWRDGDDLFEAGLIDSAAAMELIMFLETGLGVQVPDDDLDLRNFRSIDSVAALAHRLTAGSEVSAS
jgi:methoxymalonate biosynthesis acyl carrier protein